MGCKDFSSFAVPRSLAVGGDAQMEKAEERRRRGGNKRIFVASFHGFFFVGRKSRWFVIFFAPCGPPR